MTVMAFEVHLNVGSSSEWVVVPRHRFCDCQVPCGSEVPDSLQILTPIGVSVEGVTCTAQHQCSLQSPSQEKLASSVFAQTLIHFLGPCSVEQGTAECSTHMLACTA